MLRPPTSFAFALVLALGPALPAQEAGESGGALSSAQAAYDVRRYELDLELFPETRRLEGWFTVRADVLAPLEVLELDLHPDLEVVEAREGETLRGVRREGGKVFVDLGEERPVGARFTVRLRYGGVPHVATNPPWDGGFTWAETASGATWCATSCQTNGADLWWPCKDHPSDEPDDMGLRIVVPEPLVCATNGRRVGVDELEGERRAFRYEVSTPINTYCVALNVAPYVRIEREFESVAGMSFPLRFFALPENEERARRFVDEIVVPQLRWFEETFGPYPFRADKYGVAETPFLGMEHQTIIAYGNGYRARGGYDWLHHHELAHEWWGNLVTVKDWKDFWIHEGIGTYCQPLYLEDLKGERRYRREMARMRRFLQNRVPIAPREASGARSVYVKGAGNDIYYKGAWVLHSLRYLLGDATFRKALATFCYPSEAARESTDGSACRGVDTEEFVRVVEEVSGRELDWFFELYLRRAALPRLVHERREGRIEFAWETPDDLPFPMPVEVRIGTRRVRVPMEGNRGHLEVAEDEEVVVDPEHRILRELGGR